MTMNQEISKMRLWTSYILQGVLVAMLFMGAGNNILGTEMAVQGATEMGYSMGSILYLGIVLLISTVLYIYPKTSILGAVLLTGWLGGAVSTHLIHQDAIEMILFPVIFGILIWGALWLRNGRIQRIIPFLNHG